MDPFQLLLPEDELVDLFSGYLATLHSSGFGEHFSIHDDEGRDRAARWMVKNIFGMLEFEDAQLR